VPDGPWILVTLGNVYARFARADALRKSRTRLLELRNHLAHGHYVGWQAAEELVALRHILGTAWRATHDPLSSVSAKLSASSSTT
jgi:hypothetical protein